MPKVRCSCGGRSGLLHHLWGKIGKSRGRRCISGGAGAPGRTEDLPELWEGASAADAFLYILRDKNELVRRRFYT